MHVLLAIGVTILAATQAQTQPSLAPAEPVSVTFVNSEFKDAISLIARSGRLVIELDQTVTEDVQHEKIGVLKMEKVTVEEAIAALTRTVGLTYSIVDSKTVRISKKG